MKHTLVVTPAGEELILISKAHFEGIEDQLDAAAFLAAKAQHEADGGETLTSEEVRAALEATTPPLRFAWKTSSSADVQRRAPTPCGTR